MNTYTGLSPRTTAYVAVELLKRGAPLFVLEKFAQTKELPANSTDTIKFRRYLLANNGWSSGTFNPGTYFGGALMGTTAAKTDGSTTQDGTALTEGVTPNDVNLTKIDYSVSLSQYGGVTTITDRIIDFHEDPVMKEAEQILAEQAASVLEKTRVNTVIAGTNVFYANGSATTAVNTKFTYGLQAKIVRALKQQLAKPITEVTKSTPAYGTEAIAPAYICVCHTDLEYDIRSIPTFVPVEKYGSATPFEGEIGKIGEVRFITTTIMSTLATAGASGGTGVIESGGKAVVYPMIFFGANAWATVPFKGANAVTPYVVNPMASDSDPLAQRGKVGWKAYSASIILNDAWMARAEVACSSL